MAAMRRRNFLISMGAVALSACRSPVPESGEEPPLIIITSHPQGAFEALLRAVVAPLSLRLGRGVAIQILAEDGGWEAIARLRAADPDSTVLADADIGLALKQEYGRRGFTFAQLRPVAKLTDGLSVALIARADAPHAGWEGMRAALAERKLTLATTGPLTAYGVAERLLAATLGDRFDALAAPGPQAIFDAVAQGKTELGLITTVLIERFNAAAPGAGIVPLLTFGAQRSERYPETPTLAELARDNKRDFTFALGLFGRSEMPARIARGLLAALREVEADPDVAASLADAPAPLRVYDDENLREAFERDLRLIRRLGAPG